VPILPGFDAAGSDAGAREVTDRCGGRTDVAGRYHYRWPRCLGRARRAHSPLVGWARDGHPIHGPRGGGGRPLRNGDLDRCHGHSHEIPSAGRRLRAYHYHVTPEFPYTVGCFRGLPARDWSMSPRQMPAPEDPGPPPREVAPPPEQGDAPSAPPPEQGDAPSAPPGPPPAPPEIGAAPALFPSFDPAITDYVVRCDPAQPVAVSVSAPEGNSVSVDGAPGRAGDFTHDVGLGERLPCSLPAAGLPRLDGRAAG
jgi:hypothetical protein